MSNVLSIDQKLNFVQTYEKMMINIMKIAKTYTKFNFFHISHFVQKKILFRISRQKITDQHYV